MRWQDCSKTSLVLVALVVVHVISAEEAIADYIFGKPVNLGPVVNTMTGEGEGTSRLMVFPCTLIRNDLAGLAAVTSG